MHQTKKIFKMKGKERVLTDFSFLELNQEASDIYGLIHARFILSARGKS